MADDPTRDLEELYDKVNRKFSRTAIPPAVKEWAARHLRAIQPDLDQVLGGRVGFQDFLLTYIQREVERFQAEDRDAVPYDELRETPLCTCRDFQCELKKGRLPKAIRTTRTLRDGIRRFKQTHTGDPIVLEGTEDLPGARQAWAEKRGRVWYVLRMLEAYLVEIESMAPDEIDAIDEDEAASLVPDPDPLENLDAAMDGEKDPEQLAQDLVDSPAD